MNLDFLSMMVAVALVAIVLLPLLWRERQRAVIAERRAEEAEEAVAGLGAELAARETADQEAAESAARVVAVRQAAVRAAAERAATEAAAHAAAERDAEEAAARLEAEHEAATHAAAQAEREAAEAAARVEAEREATETAARLKAEREAAEAAARAAAELEAAEWEARLEAEQLAAQAAAIAVQPKEPKLPEQTVVMIADDSKVVRVKTSRLLTSHHYQVATADDGADAVKKIEASMPDLLITDVEMPGLDGFELTRHVRDNPRTSHIPIIMISSNSATIGARAAQAGVSVVMDKPYPEDELIAHIARLMT